MIRVRVRVRVQVWVSEINSGVESRNSERAYNYALGFADTSFFQGLHGFYLKRGIGPLTLHNNISDLVT